MDRREIVGERLELHVEATGRGRRMVARLADGTVLATGRHFSHLRETIDRVVSERYPGAKVALMVGPARRPSAEPGVAPVSRPALSPGDGPAARV
jgi:hypothetical protein